MEVLPASGHTEYLGRLLGFSAFHDTEIDHRINKAWAKFHMLKSELCCQYYPLRERLRLFNAVITPSVLYGSSTWTMTASRERRLKSAQRRTLRMGCKTGRKPEETWVEWVRRATHYADAASQDHNVECWVVAQRRRKYKWAGHVARMSDDRWTFRALCWRPISGTRAVGRPHKRWADDLDLYFATTLSTSPEDWIALAQSRDDWRSYEDDFCSRV